MARPIKEGMDYFPHDTDARNDLKIRKLRAVFGNDGYATYFILLENIYRQKLYELDVLDDETLLILAEECKVDFEKFKNILSKCLSLELFDKELYEKNHILTSNAIKNRSEPIESTRARKRNWKNNKNTEVLDGENKVLDGENAQRKEKESKEKKSKEEKRKEQQIKENEIEPKGVVSSGSGEDFNIYTYMQRRGFITISAITAEQIKADIEMYSIEEVKQAIDIADNNGKHTYSYVKGILEKRRAGQSNNQSIEWNEMIEKAKRGEEPF